MAGNDDKPSKAGDHVNMKLHITLLCSYRAH